MRCLLSLPLLPTGEIVQAVSNIRPEIADGGQVCQHVDGLKKLVAYINKQWINKRSVGPERKDSLGELFFAVLFYHSYKVCPSFSCPAFSVNPTNAHLEAIKQLKSN